MPAETEPPGELTARSGRRVSAADGRNGLRGGGFRAAPARLVDRAVGRIASRHQMEALGQDRLVKWTGRASGRRVDEGGGLRAGGPKP